MEGWQHRPCPFYCHIRVVSWAEPKLSLLASLCSWGMHGIHSSFLPSDSEAECHLYLSSRWYQQFQYAGQSMLMGLWLVVCFYAKSALLNSTPFLSFPEQLGSSHMQTSLFFWFPGLSIDFWSYDSSAIFDMRKVGVLKCVRFHLQMCVGEKLPLLLKPHATWSSSLMYKPCSQEF